MKIVKYILPFTENDNIENTQKQQKTWENMKLSDINQPKPI